jgi:hypothetical protein
MKVIKEVIRAIVTIGFFFIYFELLEIILEIK